MTPRFAIDEFTRPARPHDDHRELFAMLEAYLDESGIHEGASVCVIAGYFGTAREWRKFEEDWRKLLADHLVPRDKFHANDVFKKAGFFHRWGHKSYQEFVKGVLETILNHLVFPVGAAIIVEDFNSFSLDERKFMTGATLIHRSGKLEGGCPTKPYFVPFQLCLKTIADHTPGRAKTQFYFGLDRSFYSYASDLFHDMKLKAQWREKLGNATLALAEETPELQAADVLAYLTYGHVKEHFGTNAWPVQPESKLAFLLRRANTLEDFRYFHKAALQEQLEALRSEFRVRGQPPPL
jgi:hypothetical protein